jgi:response regulator RpfG family c-di-GMP phosphodiesterase
VENNKVIKYKGDLIKHVGNAIAVTNKLLSIDTRSVKIIHLDDHKIISDSILICIRKKFPNAIIKCFQNSQMALDYVRNCFQNIEKLDLIITGINLRQPELDGIVFSKTIRKEEIVYKRQIPILGIDVYDDKIIIQKFLEVGLARYLNLTISCEEINLTVSDMITTGYETR